MELNGYGYEDFSVQMGGIKMPSYEIMVTEGEFILNLQDGRKQLFNPIKFDLHSPSEHTIAGNHYDVELQILHHYKGTDEQLGAIIGIFFDVEEAKDVNKENAFIQSIIDASKNGEG